MVFKNFKLLLIVWILSLVLFFHCSPNKPSVGAPVKNISGMRQICATGQTFLMGADDSMAAVDERPPMKVGFTYNYWLDTTEVTQGEYFAVTGKRPVADTSASGVGDRNPVYNVSWFDAILFCNTKSKLLNLDTVYSYSAAPKMQGGSVYNLTDVHIHYERWGVRLPTEAEWEFAAREETSGLPFPHLEDSTRAQSYAWYGANAGGQTHAAATRMPNALGLYDMAGNLFEWTGDWKGYFNGRAITNAVGAQNPDNDNERVVKGGSFETGFSSLRPSRRGATYPTPQSAAVEYLGFRCAYGILPAVFFITADSTSSITNSTVLVTSDVRPFLGTRRARLVFVNVTNAMRTLCYVDFSRSYPYIFEFKDCDTVYKPVISPNGRYVAFCTRGDGSAGAAHIYVRDLDSLSPLSAAVALPSDSAFGPRWWVDPATGDTFLLYTNSAVDNTNSQWSASATFMVKMSGKNAAASPRQLSAGGGFHDGGSVSGRYLVTGYRSLLLRDLQTPQTRQLFLSPLNGKGPDGSTQVCNTSMSPDSGPGCRMMFLDFGCPPPSKSSLTAESYGVHEYIFVCNDSGRVASWYKYPAGEASWDNPQWSNVAGLAASCARSGADQAHAVYAVNLHDSSYLKMVEGAELAHPFLWKDPRELLNTDSLDLDSLGNYDEPSITGIQEQFTIRMHQFWQKRKDMRIVFVGSSHTAFGVDPKVFSRNTGVYNMGVIASDFRTTREIIADYVLNHCPSLQLIGCDIILGNLICPQLNFNWKLDISVSKGYNYDLHHGFWKGGFPNNFDNLMNGAPCPVDATLDTLGIHQSACMGWGGANPDILRDYSNTLTWTIQNTDYLQNFSYIKNVINSIAQAKIHFLLFITPESPYYKNTASYALHGPNRETASAVISQLRAMEDSIPYFHFYDANVFGNHDYADSEANNFDHLCPAGAKKLSARLDSLIQAILGR